MSRTQLALNVEDLEAVHRLLLEAVRNRTRQGPPRLRQLRRDRTAAQARPYREPRTGRQHHHLGVEVADADTVGAEQTPLAGAGFASIDERDTTCCCAKQDRFWVEGGPNGERWEIYTVLADSPTFSAPTFSATATGTGSTCLRNRRQRNRPACGHRDSESTGTASSSTTR